MTGLFFYFVFGRSGEPQIGATFSTIYSEKLGLDLREVFLAALDDLKIKKFRIPVYWSEIEPEQGKFVWDDLDFIVAEAGKRDAELTLVIGRKVPRWPECFIPDWAEGLEYNQAEAAVLKMEREVVNRYKESPAVVAWQVENEPFFPFGVCPAPNKDFFSKEVDLVKSLDKRPIMITVSGEMDPWILSAIPADILGISMYRMSWNQALGFFPYPLSPAFYRLRALASGIFAKVTVSELQAEPWFTKPIEELTASERAEAFTVEDLVENLEFASDAGFSEVYLWGIEWWYVEKLAGRPELWKAGKQ